MRRGADKIKIPPLVRGVGRSRRPTAREIERRRNSLKIRDLEQTWLSCRREPREIRDVRKWSPKERGQVNHIIRAWQGTAEQLHDFLEFCANNWEVILRSKFDWMRDAPANPGIGFILGFYEKFMDMWTQQEITDTARDRGRVEQLRVMGYTPEQAEARAAMEEEYRAANRKLRERERRVAQNLKEVRQVRAEIRKTTSPKHRGGRTMGEATRNTPSMNEIPNYYEDDTREAPPGAKRRIEKW